MLFAKMMAHSNKIELSAGDSAGRLPFCDGADSGTLILLGRLFGVDDVLRHFAPRF